MLRYALSMSHGDRALIQLLERDQIVVAGYSAGSCVLGPDLKGLELVDSPDEVTVRYGSAPIYEGMHVLPYAIAPHFRFLHPETEAIDNLVDYYLDHGVAFRTLERWRGSSRQRSICGPVCMKKLAKVWGPSFQRINSSIARRHGFRSAGRRPHSRTGEFPVGRRTCRRISRRIRCRQCTKYSS